MIDPRPSLRGQHFRDDRQDERDRQRQPQSCENIRHRIRQRDLADEVEPRHFQHARKLNEPRLDRLQPLDGAEQHRPDGTERDHGDDHRLCQAEQQDRHRDDGGRRQRAQHLQGRLQIGPRARRQADHDARGNADHRRGDEAFRHPPHRAGNGAPQLAGFRLGHERIEGGRRPWQEHRRNEFGVGDELPDRDQRGGDNDASEEAQRRGHDGFSAQRPNR